MKRVFYFKLKSFVYVVFGVCFLWFVGVYFSDDSVLREYFRNGEYKEALELVRGRLHENPNDLLALEYRARIYLTYSLQHAGYLDQLESEYLKRSFETLDFLVNLDDAEKRLGEEYRNVCFLLGFTYFLQGDYKPALKYIDLSVNMDENIDDLLEFVEESNLDLFVKGERYSVAPYSLLGYLAYKSKAYKKAIESFSRITTNGEMIYHFYLAVSYDTIGLKTKAIQKYKEVILKEDREFIRFRACVSLSDLFFEQGDYTNAQKYLHRAQLIQPSADVLYRLGVIYESQGKISFALSKWRKALRLSPDHNLSRLKLNRFSFKRERKS